jgi:hypothetical protein
MTTTTEDIYTKMNYTNIYVLKFVINIDIDFKSANGAANKINSKKRNAANNSQRFANMVGHCLFILLYWGGTGNR